MQITSTKSERVTAVRALHSRSGRRKAGRFLVEGPATVASALEAGAVVTDLYVTDITTPVVALARAAGVRVSEVSEPVMQAMAETKRPAGVLAVCELLSPISLQDAMGRSGPVVVLDSVSDPGNVGTVIRSAAAAGAAAVVLTPECADVHNGKVVRSTAGSLFHLPVLSGQDIDQIAAAAASAGRTVAVAAGEGADDLFDLAARGAVDERTCWVIGSEAHGAGPRARALADRLVRIPMSPGPESLNAAVAASVIVFVVRFAEHRAGMKD